jgi:hypothetical protein
MASSGMFLQEPHGVTSQKTPFFSYLGQFFLGDATENLSPYRLLRTETVRFSEILCFRVFRIPEH